MWGEREREREDAFGMGKKRTTARNGARHAIGARENLVLHFTPFYAPPRLSHVVHVGRLRRSLVLYRVCRHSIESNELWIDVRSIEWLIIRFSKLGSIRIPYSRMLKEISFLNATNFPRRIGIFVQVFVIKSIEVRIVYSKIRLKRRRFFFSISKVLYFFFFQDFRSFSVHPVFRRAWVGHVNV